MARTATGRESVAGVDRSRDPRWIVGPGVDLFVGAGLAYLVSLPLLLWWGAAAELSAWPILAVTLISLLVSAPHYGATLLRVYEERSERQRYAFFALYLTLALVIVFVAGVYWPIVGSLLLTLYVSWSPWHVGAQNYGVSLMFLGRQGVDVSDRAKRLLQTSFFLSFVLALLSIHVADSSHVPAPGIGAGAIYSILPIGLPRDAVLLAAPALLLAYVGTVLGALGLLSRAGASPLALFPVVSLIASQSLWFIVPALLFFWRGVNAETLLPFAAIWISAAHSAQYLWVTTHFAKRARPETRTLTYLRRTLLAGAFVTIFPGLLFVPAFMGAPSWAAGLGTLLFAVANIHHFVLDGAVWKLREGRVARALLQDAASPRDASSGASRGNSGASDWAWRVVFVAGLLALVVTLHEQFERTVTLRGLSLANLPRARAAVDRLSFTGRANQVDHLVLAQGYAQVGDLSASEARYRESLRYGTTLAALTGLGEVQTQARKWAVALETFDRAQTIAPGDIEILVRRIDLLAQLESEMPALDRDARAAFRARAEPLLARAIEMDRGRTDVILRLAHLLVRDGRRDEARALVGAAYAGLTTIPEAERAALREALSRLAE